MSLPDRVFHLAERSNWPSIRRLGLLPATQLIERSGLSGRERELVERRQRTEHTVLPGGLCIRDQKPMPPKALAACLVGMAPADWYAVINERVFFWLDPGRLNRQRAACEPRPQVVLTIDAGRLASVYGARMAVSPINTGNARRRPSPRGASTFVPLATWIETGWASEASALGVRERARSHPPAELTIVGPVPDVLAYVVDVAELAPGESFVPG